MPKLRFAGYAAIFNARDRGGDIIRPGAFRRTLSARKDVPLLWQHRRGRVIGTIETLEEDDKGLRIIAKLSNDAIAANLGEGKTGGLSFGYHVRQGNTGKGRELLDLDLVEVSLVATPMQPLARVHAVSGSVTPNTATQQ